MPIDQSDDPIELTPGPEAFTREQLELVQIYNTVSFSKANWEAVLSHLIKTQELELKQHESVSKTQDYNLERTKLALQPHLLYHAEVFYSKMERKFVCELSRSFEMGMGDMSMTEDDVEGDADDIRAYGDSPAEACHNFDHIWLYGKPTPDLEN